MILRFIDEILFSTSYGLLTTYWKAQQPNGKTVLPQPKQQFLGSVDWYPKTTDFHCRRGWHKARPSPGQRASDLPCTQRQWLILSPKQILIASPRKHPALPAVLHHCCRSQTIHSVCSFACHNLEYFHHHAITREQQRPCIPWFLFFFRPVVLVLCKTFSDYWALLPLQVH